MAKTATLSTELRNAIIWLERQPGVLSVVQGRYTRVRHHHKPGFTRVRLSDDKGVTHVVSYDAKGVKDLFVHAPASPQRDAWVARLATGDVLSTTAGNVIAAKAKLVVTPPPMLDVPPKGNAQHAISDDFGKLYTITVDLATKWLEDNTRNRKLRQATIERYAADMRAGRWFVSNDAIAFDRNGALVNGQHRLWAVIESGVSVPMLVVTGLDPDVINVMDDHMKRSLTDVAQIRKPGTVVSTMHAAIAKMLLRTSIMATALERTKMAERLSRQAELDALERHADAIDFACRECIKSNRIRGITQAAVLTPVARAWYTEDRDRLRAFGHVLITGLTETPKDMAVIMLRNWLLKQVGGSRALTGVVYGKTERALRSFLDGTKIASLFEASSELFPLPEDGKLARTSGNRRTNRLATEETD